ncbi:hypothetical protein FPQ18DRAFT_390524 [Pyronema domesticum]|uniref:CCHC-type domain-containing protein n=1 Tax=Pyronema omphalodes (strain CBS 100304) TaxID=1076935 RepID=U4LQR5_PYROM|nr:hypothetical protein FPQ18DRAFT_390524 [Pyronema domesticum]CCX33899.1 Protein of unknown function [Pyronema omphalodes CBS 100304]
MSHPFSPSVSSSEDTYEEPPMSPHSMDYDYDSNTPNPDPVEAILTYGKLRATKSNSIEGFRITRKSSQVPRFIVHPQPKLGLRDSIRNKSGVQVCSRCGDEGHGARNCDNYSAVWE